MRPAAADVCFGVRRKSFSTTAERVALMTTAIAQNAITLRDEAITKLQSKTAQIGIIGLGYVGLPLGLLFTEEGFRVTGFDIDTNKVNMLESSRSYICRIPETEIALARDRGFHATADFAHVKDMDAIVICVPTPLSEYREPDMSYVTATVSAIARHLTRGQLIVLESTTYPGTTEEIVMPLLEQGNQMHLRSSHDEEDAGDVFFLAFSPEREDPGNNTVARRDIPKVVGGVDRFASEIANALYSAIFRRTIQVSSTTVAEMTKLLENVYRCVNIALVNELKLLCLRMGIDIWEVIGAAATKPFGFQPFYPGPGLGGHCIPVDPFYLAWKAREYDFATRFIELAGEVNAAMPYHVVDSVAEALNVRRKAMSGSRILVLGVSYKKDIDDLRESPAITIIEILQKRGAHVSYNDPYFPKIGKGRKYNLEMQCVPLDHLNEYDCVLIVSDHSEYDFASIVNEAQLVVDTRNATAGIHSTNVVRC
jgi:UDP-N-acetyl-D-glucosamine dehydrogenase